jgi:aminoglycoside phosphotransferase (APT) family kinase protein
VLTEDVGSASSAVPAHQGTDVIRFGALVPAKALSSAARALAELHTSRRLPLPGTPVRAASDEALKAAKRGGVVAGHVPELATSALTVSAEVSSALAGLGQVVSRPSHGSYKPSQLLYRDGHVFIVDFDQFALADPALDVGYFLAYLRPPGLWYRRSGTRDWFSSAAGTFLDTYAAYAAEHGMSPDEVEALLRRCHVYEAALLLKIAARRSNRLHSPRPAEVRAILAEVRTCLEAGRR